MIDLAMWTLNSEKTLEQSLRSIEKAMPADVVGQKIMVDGHSEDNTAAIGEKYGWHIYDAEHVGIPYQANQALRQVRTEIFASFEHDILLNKDWFNRVLPHLQSDDIAVAQGVRYCTNKILYAIEKQGVISEMARKNYVSLDNNLYKTDIIKKMGGFNTDYLFTLDGELQNRLRASGYKWIVDRNIVSGHLRLSYWDAMKHNSEFMGKLTVTEKPQLKLSTYTRILCTSPLRGLEIALKQNCPKAFFAYPLMRFIELKKVLNLKKNVS